MNTEMPKEKIFVTGATGFVGASLTRKLIEEGYGVHISVRESSNKWRINDVLPNIKEHLIDLTDSKNLRKLLEKIRPDVIFHLANAGVYGGKHLPEREVIKANIIGTFNLINACEKINYRCFINTGSSSEYGIKNNAMKETDICEPNGIYGVTKLTSTLYASNFAKKNNRPIVNIRLFSPFGPYDDPSRLITYATINAIKENDLILASPDAVRDYIYVDDINNFFIKIIPLAEKLEGETFNFGSGEERKISFVVDKIIEFTGSKSRILWNKIHGRDFDVQHWKADMNKTKKIFGNVVERGFEEGLKMTVEWFKDNNKLYKDL